MSKIQASDVPGIVHSTAEIPTGSSPRVIGETCLPCRLHGETCLPCRLHGETCGNCEAALSGPFCHMCGQPVRSPVREFFGFVWDGTSEFMRPDGKFFRTLVALYFRPGLLTARYLDGQRVYFIKPVKLYFSLSVILFLLASFGVNFESKVRPKIQANQHDFVIGFGAPSAESAIAPAKGAANQISADPSVLALTATTTPPAGTKNRPQIGAKTENVEEAVEFDVNGKPWQAQTNPMVIAWLPNFANTWINAKLAHLNETAKIAEAHPEKVTESFFRVLPTMMFVLLPIFALVLKLLYFFRKRLYAEHLLVAVQSHSFIFLSFIVLTLLSGFAALAGTGIAKITTPIMVILACWMPIYLLLMQKRVYQQGWFWTLFKYGVGGFVYLMLLSFGLAFAIIAALVSM
jgi:hypothetical protein